MIHCILGEMDWHPLQENGVILKKMFQNFRQKF